MTRASDLYLAAMALNPLPPELAAGRRQRRSRRAEPPIEGPEPPGPTAADFRAEALRYWRLGWLRRCGRAG